MKLAIACGFDLAGNLLHVDIANAQPGENTYTYGQFAAHFFQIGLIDFAEEILKLIAVNLHDNFVHES